MSLSLVDYGSSSDSEDDDQQQQRQQPNQQKTAVGTSGGLSQLLPPPKNNKTNTTNTTTKKSIFYLPSAKELDAADDEEDEKPVKRLKRGTISSNLTDLLPAPKNTLNPFRKTPVPTSTPALPAKSAMPTSRSEDTTQPELGNDHHHDNHSNNETDDDQDEIEEQEEPTKTTSSKFTGSFFHIGSKLKEQATTKTKSTAVTTAAASSTAKESNSSQLIEQQQQQQHLPVLEDPNAMYAFGADPNAYYQYYYPQQQQEDVSSKETLDYDALSQLGGKRRGENAGVNIIDVNQTDILPTDEWRRQAEAQQPKLAATSTPATFDVNSAKKKKNNIMALAAQAKSMESTLEERYAQQRVAKNQARNRYGF